jgi:DMSO/TMAO reductase YedYZ molybdopterin-dependent catalytic subunit
MPHKALIISIPILLAAAVFAPRAAVAQKSAASGPSTITITGAVTTPLTLSVAELEKMPQTTLSVVNPHSHKAEVYKGVSLDALLVKAGVPQGEAIRGKWIATCVVASAADGYRVVFSLPELDPGFLDSDVLVADQLNGAPIGADEGPLKLVAPRDKRPARWIRMLKSITVVRLPEPQ